MNEFEIFKITYTVYLTNPFKLWQMQNKTIEGQDHSSIFLAP